MNKPEIKRDLTVANVAQELSIRREAVVKFMQLGLLKGYDVTLPGAKRKTYRITREALDAFKESRTAEQPAVARRRPRTTPPGIKEWV